jgi:hypothetical protein
MSHTTTLKGIKIQNTEALKESVQFLQQQGVKCELLENATPRMYYNNQHGKCDFVLKLADSPYDVGFDKQADGSYVPVYDSWGGHIQKAIGSPTSCPVPKTAEEKAATTVARLLDCYSIHAAKSELQNSGEYYQYEVSYDTTDGSYTLEASELY